MRFHNLRNIAYEVLRHGRGFRFVITAWFPYLIWIIAHQLQRVFFISREPPDSSLCGSLAGTGR
jgi:hypothetical protein